MSSIENLRVGIWIALTSSECHRDMFGVSHGPPIDGTPLRVEAISPPFIAVSDVYGTSGSVDTRIVEWTRLNRSYVNSAIGSVKREKSGGKLCPLCGEMLRERLVRSRWHFICECGLRAEVRSDR